MIPFWNINIWPYTTTPVLCNILMFQKTLSCYVAAWMGGEFGGEQIHVYVWLSLFAVSPKLSQNCLLISYTSIQSKKLFKTS